MKRTLQNPLQTLLLSLLVPCAQVHAVSVAVVDNGRLAWGHAWGPAQAGQGYTAAPRYSVRPINKS